MKIKAQVCMVMNLDKYIGCHTCSITCKNVWTNRPSAEYMYSTWRQSPASATRKTGKTRLEGWLGLGGGDLFLKTGSKDGS